MKVAVFGGTGHVSKYLVDELVSVGHQVRLLSRNPMASRNHVETLVGDALSASDVRRVLEGCQAVVNCVGSLKNRDGFYSVITANILDNMAQLGLSRYLLITNSATQLPTDSATFFTRLGVLGFRLLFPQMLADKQRELELVVASDTDWAVFRLPLVLDSPQGGPARTDARSLRGWFISNGAVARTIAQEVGGAHHREAVFLFA